MTQQPPPPPISAKTEEEKKAAASPLSLDISKPTTGEKWYHRVTLAINFVGTFISSALISFGVLENKWYNENVTKPMEKWKFGGKEFGEDNAKNLNSTFWLMQGGNLMLIPMHYMEKNMKSMVQYFNKKFGREEEVAIYEQRHQDVPKKSWGDFVKGRIVAFLVVWGGFTLAGKFWGKKMRAFEEGTGEKFAKLIKRAPYELNADDSVKKDSKTLKDGTLDTWDVPTAANKLGRMFALDAFATLTAVSILDVAAGFFSKGKKEEKPSAEATKENPGLPAGETIPTPTGQKIDPKAQDRVNQAIKEKTAPREESFAAEREKEKIRAAEQPVAAFATM